MCATASTVPIKKTARGRARVEQFEAMSPSELAAEVRKEAARLLAAVIGTEAKTAGDALVKASTLERLASLIRGLVSPRSVSSKTEHRPIFRAYGAPLPPRIVEE